MNAYNHLNLPVHKSDTDRRKREKAVIKFNLLDGRDKQEYVGKTIRSAEKLTSDFEVLKRKFSGRIDPTLIYEIKVNQSVAIAGFEQSLTAMGLHVLSIAENRKGYWVVFSDDEQLNLFKSKLSSYSSPDGPKYEFFNAIESVQDIPIEDKIGVRLLSEPIGEVAEFVDVEIWKMTDPQKNETFIAQLNSTFDDRSRFRITDKLITNSFVLLRIKLDKTVYDELIQLKEIARIDRPALPDFSPYEYTNPDITDFGFNLPDHNACGVLIIDSGIISNHPMLERCVGTEENFQSGENELHDTVGHGTSVGGCAVYGDIEKCLEDREFNPDNWLFSAKVMYAERNDFNNDVRAVYDPSRLLEHQLKDAIDSFLQNEEYRIKVVNISLGNTDEIWHKNFRRQLPLAALIDELALTYSNVLFIVSAGNQDPRRFYNEIHEIKENYPNYLIDNDEFKIINPATAALALTVGSIADEVRVEESRYGQESICVPIAENNLPSPFTRTGFGVNGMLKPELVEKGGNLLLRKLHNRIIEDKGGKLILLNNNAINDLFKFDYGTSFSAPKVANLASRICNRFPQGSSNFVKNLILVGSDQTFEVDKNFYKTDKKSQGEALNLHVCGYGLPQFDKAVTSFDNRIVLFEEGQIGLDKIKIFTVQLPETFFNENGKKKIVVTLTFNPETRLTRGDSYLGNRMEFHLFHTVNPDILLEKYGANIQGSESIGVPEELKKYEIGLFPGQNIRKVGCHQKGWKVYKREPSPKPIAPISLVLLNYNKWIYNTEKMQDYCISITFEHENEIELYNELRANVQARTRVR